MNLTRFTLLLLLVPAPALAQDSGADTCKAGFVWREAYPGDHVCVETQRRSDAAEDNRLASSRRVPSGGAYGPNTCRAGFVWREAREGDLVCVTPERRAQTSDDNQAAASRVAQPLPAERRASRVKRAINRDAITLSEQERQPYRGPLTTAAPAGGSAKRGFDENGQPYIEEQLADGTVRRTQQNGVTLTKPDGTSQFVPFQSVMANAQPPTPPDLPSDPTRGRAWVEGHNKALLGLIRALVNNNEAEMTKFSTAESKSAGSDVFHQVEYRTRVLEILAKP